VPVITPKNWADFQHYKDRNPPWIKLHKGLLDNYEYHRLPVASKAIAPLLWLLASETKEGHIDADLANLAFRLRMSEGDIEKAIKPLVNGGFFIVVQAASTSLADCKQDAKPETETEREKRLPAIAGERQPPKTTEPTPRKRDEIFDALAKVHGLSLNEITRSAGGMLAKAKADIIAVTPNVTSQEVYRRFRNLKLHRPEKTNHTAPNLAKLWGMCGDSPRSGQDDAALIAARRQATIDAGKLARGEQ
jgi:hypothetical protein